MDRFIYPANIIPDDEDGGFVVRFVDFPEAITQGETITEALHEAADCLEEAIANRIATEIDIPLPSPLLENQYNIALTTYMAIRVALYMTMRELNISEIELARRLNQTEYEIHSLFDLDTNPDIKKFESALAVMGRQVVVGVQVQ